MNTRRVALYAAVVTILRVTPLSAEDTPLAVPTGLTLRTGFGIGNQTLGFDIGESNLSSDNLNVNPNIPLHWIIGVEWRRIGLAVRIKLPATIANLETRGSTEFTNIQLQFFGDRNAIELNAQQHTGMYIANADRFDEEITDTRLPDLRLTTFGASYYRAINPIHSLAASYKLNAWSERSTGSAIVLGSYSLVGIEAPGGPARTIPAAEDTIWSNDVFILSNTISVGGGYAALLTWRNLFIAPLAALSLGAQWAEYWIGSETDDGFSIVPNIHIRLSAGINGPRWISAIMASIDFRNVQTPYLNATQGSNLVEIVVGRRFDLEHWRGTRGIAY